MHRTIFKLLAVSLFVFGGMELLRAQAVVEGRVADATTGQALEGAHIFLSGTKLGTQTDRLGRYALWDIPTGSYRLVITMIGYERKVNSLEVGPGDHINIDLSLKPMVYEMEELTVDDPGRKWRKNLEYFEKLFLGTSENADSVIILNPEVLRFDSNFWGRLTAEALAPLQIVNKSLGYEITYYLYEFKHTGLTTFWDGEPLFKEMTPSGPLQQFRWEYNRIKAFYGSVRHFWLAVLHDRVEEEGFRIYKVREHVFPGEMIHRFRVSAEDLIRPGAKEYLKRIQFLGSLEIIYMHEAEDRRYLQWIHERAKGPGGPQVSRLELNDNSITVDEAGEVIEPYGVTRFGYFWFHRLADLTPREYRPNGFEMGSQ